MSHALSTIGWFASVAGWYFYQQRRDSPKRNIERRLLGKLAVVTRIHGEKSLDYADKDGKLSQFISRVQDYADVLLICIGSADRKTTQAYCERYQQIVRDTSSGKMRVEVLELDPWGYFINSLNQALTKAADLQCSHILYQSLEYSIERSLVTRLCNQFQKSDDVLVVGPMMDGHEFCAGDNILRGRTCPWNTCAVWDVEKLSILGFPMVGDGVYGSRSSGGVEEVSAIAILQKLFPSWKALLVKVENSTQSNTWNTDFQDSERTKYHEQKMKSKDSRPNSHLKALQLSGLVQHIVI